MNTVLNTKFDEPDLATVMDRLSAEEMDGLDFGIIGFDADGLVKRYNRCETMLAGLSADRVLGTPLFTAVAPCMNNYLVAQRFEDAIADGTRLDATIDYVFTLRMRPVKVKLRLLAAPGLSLRYVLVDKPN